MKHNIEKNTEAIGTLDDVQVFWEPISGPYIKGNEVHMPLVPEEDIKQSDIEMFRGYIDHEVRHKRHTKNWNDYISKFTQLPMLKNIANCLEDVRIELIDDGKQGEQQNLRNLRKKFAYELDQKINDYQEFSAMISAFMYRRLGIEINLKNEYENKYKEMKPFWDEFDTCKSLDDIIILSEKLIKLAQDEEQLSEMNNNDQSVCNEDESEGDSSIVVDSDEEQDSDGQPSNDQNDEGDGQSSNAGDDESDEDSDDQQNGSGSGKNDQSKDDESEDEDADTDGSGSNDGDSDDDQSDDNGQSDNGQSDDDTGLGTDGGEDKGGDESSEDGNTINDSINDGKVKDFGAEGQDIDKINSELTDQDIENWLKNKIEEVVGEEEIFGEQEADRIARRYTSYTKGDIHHHYENDGTKKWTGWDIEHDSPLNVNKITKSLYRCLWSNTDTFKVNGFKKGKRIAKTRLSGFSQGLNDKPFYREVNKKQLEARISILVDLSGSMSFFVNGKNIHKSLYKNSKIFKAISLAYSIGMALSRIQGIDFEIVGFFTVSTRYHKEWRSLNPDHKNFTGFEPKIYEYFHSFDEKFKPKKFKSVCQQILHNYIKANTTVEGLGSLQTFMRANADSETLLYTIQKLNRERKPNQKTMVFVISDGQPNNHISPDVFTSGDNPILKNGKPSMKHLKKIIELSRKEYKIPVMGFGFSDAHSIQDIYGKEFSVYRKNFEDLSDDFVKELEKKLLSTLK